MYYTYMIRVEGGALYTGIAKSMFSRMKEHAGQGDKSAKFTRSRKIISLEGLWSSENRSTASRLEYALKTLSKKKKEALLQEPSLLWVYLPEMEREDYTHHPLANLELFLEQESLMHLL